MTTKLDACGRALVALLAIACTGCGVTLSAAAPSVLPSGALTVRTLASRRCMHGATGADSPYREPLPGPVTDPELARHLASFDPFVRRTAVAAGLESLLARTMRARDAAADPHDHVYLAMRQELVQRIGSLQTQLTAMEFECDCVRALLYAVLSDYEEGETDRQLAYTIASLVAGTAASIVAASWDLANAHADEPFGEDVPLVISIGGAVVGTALGAAVLVRQPREIVYAHEHNILTPIVAGADPDFLYPTFVFSLLTMPVIRGGPTPRDELVAAWREAVEDTVAEDERALAESIVYGAGGMYHPRLLSLHQDLLQLLGGALDSLARDIDLLDRAVAIALEVDFDERESDTAAR